MADTSFSAIDPPGVSIPLQDLPTGPVDDAAMAATLAYLAEDPPPGGGLWSTAGDLMRFARAWLGGGTLEGARLLPPAWILTSWAASRRWASAR